MTVKSRWYNRSFSSGSMLDEDVLPAIIEAISDRLEEISLEENHAMSQERYGKIQAEIGDIERRMEYPGYYESEDRIWDSEALWNIAEELAPEGCFVGSHPGDGADFGFWDVK